MKDIKNCNNCKHLPVNIHNEPCNECVLKSTRGKRCSKWEPMVEKSNVNHPAHYQGKHECIDEMIAMFGVEAVKAFCKCNVYKYRFRADRKNGQEDLLKAEWYMNKLMELEER